MLVKRTPLYAKHLALNARMAPFAGFEMPIRYSSILDEHRKVRSGAGIFDLSHMGEFRIAGSKAEEFLQRMTVNDVSKIRPGDAQYTVMCTEQGGIVDDCVLYRLEKEFILVVNASNIEKDLEWLNGHRISGVELKDVSDETCLIAVQGPDSRSLLAAFCEDPSILDNLDFYRHSKVRIGDYGTLISRTGYTGELGYEIYLESDEGPALWDMLMEAGDRDRVTPVGLGARDTLRIEMKYSLYGNDIDETTNPIEAGLGWIVKLQKGNFVGSGAIEKIKSRGPFRKLVGFSMKERSIPRKGYPILVDGDPAGEVTSGCHSPSLDKGIGLGYLPVAHAGPGTEIEVEIRGTPHPAVVEKTPFWKHGSASAF